MGVAKSLPTVAAIQHGRSKQRCLSPTDLTQQNSTPQRARVWKAESYAILHGNVRGREPISQITVHGTASRFPTQSDTPTRAHVMDQDPWAELTQGTQRR